MKEARSTGVTSDAVEAMGRFGVDLLARLEAKAESGNVFVSPFGVSQALLLATNGAAGPTRDSLASTLRFDPAAVKAVNLRHAEIREHMAQESQGGYGMQLVTANALWADKQFSLMPEYVENCRRYYDAEASTLDFARGEQAAAAINAWVDQNTKGRIPTIVDASVLEGPPPATVVLTNAVYFKARWSEGFAAPETKPEPFTVSPGVVRQVPMMRSLDSEAYAYRKGNGFSAARVGYVGDAALYVLLPDVGNDLPGVLRTLNEQNWSAWREGWDYQVKMDLYLPRFTTEFSEDLLPTLAIMGMGPAISPGADFTPMGLKGGAIGSVLHKTFLAVDEEGTEAAAATAVGLFGGPPPEPREKEKIVFKVDRPFLLAVVDERQGTPLFLGAIHDPIH